MGRNEYIRALSLQGLNHKFRKVLPKPLETDEEVIAALPYFESTYTDKAPDGTILASGKNLEVSVKKMILKILFPASRVLAKAEEIRDAAGNVVGCEGKCWIWLESAGAEDRYETADGFGQRRMTVDEANPLAAMTTAQRTNVCMALVKGYAFAEAARELGIGAGYPLYGSDTREIARLFGVSDVVIAENKALSSLNGKIEQPIGDVALPLGKVTEATEDDLKVLAEQEEEKEEKKEEKKRGRKKKSVVSELQSSAIKVSEPAPSPTPDPISVPDDVTEPADQEPVTQDPADQGSVTQGPADQEPVTQESADQEPASQPLADDPAPEAANSEEPVATESDSSPTPEATSDELAAARAFVLTSMKESPWAGKTFGYMHDEAPSVFNWCLEHASYFTEDENNAIRVIHEADLA